MEDELLDFKIEQEAEKRIENGHSKYSEEDIFGNLLFGYFFIISIALFIKGIVTNSFVFF